MLVLEGHQSPVLTLAYSPDGRQLFSGSRDGSACCWDLSTGEVISSAELGEPIVSAAFSPNGYLLAIGLRQRILIFRALEPLTTKPYAGVGVTRAGGGSLMAFDSDSRSMALTGYLEDAITLWDCLDWGRITDVAVPTGTLALAASGQSPLLVVGGGKGRKGILADWDLQSRSLSRWYSEEIRWERRKFDYWEGKHVTVTEEVTAAHTAPVYSVAISQDARLLASGSKDKTAKIWDAESGERLVTLEGHSSTVMAVGFDPDGDGLLTAEEKGIIRLWDTDSGHLRTSWDWQIGTLRNVVFAPDGMTVAAGGSNHSIMVWDMEF